MTSIICYSTGYLTKEMAKVKKQFDQKNQQINELEKWTSKLCIEGNSAAGCSNTEVKPTPTPILGQQSEVMVICLIFDVL